MTYCNNSIQCAQEDNLSIADIPHCVKIKEDSEYFSSKKSKIFLPIGFVEQDTFISSKSSDAHSVSNNACSHPVNTHVPIKASCNLAVGSAVQCINKEQYGVIRWIGTLPGDKATYAGVEMVRHLIELRI